MEVLFQYHWKMVWGHKEGKRLCYVNFDSPVSIWQYKNCLFKSN